MPTFVSANRFFVAIVVFAVGTICIPLVPLVPLATAQTFTATRLDGDASTAVLDPIIDASTFISVGGDGVENDSGTTTPTHLNIDGPSIIRIPDWIPIAQRTDESAQYYAYFAHHGGDNIRMAWSASITGPWNLFNPEHSNVVGIDRSVGGTVTPGNGVLDIDLGTGGELLRPTPGSPVGITRHVASPDVLIDDVNQQIVLGFHSPPRISPNAQRSFVATSKYGLNFNPDPDNGDAADGYQGEVGHGVRNVILGESYFRHFEIGGRAFAYANNGNLYQAPAFNDAGEVNTLANADSAGGWYNPSASHNLLNDWWTEIEGISNPIERFYVNELGEGPDDPRHFAIYTRTHLDPSDTNIYAFYSAKFDSPERIFLSVIDTNDGSTNPLEWNVLGQEEILEPEVEWEGVNFPFNEDFGNASQSGQAINVRQLRDPYVFEDDDGQLYLFYSGAGENAIGVASLTFNSTEVLLGDMNGSGEVNNQDIMSFALALFDRSAYSLMFPEIDPDEVGDFSDDGVMNNIDIAGFAAVLFP